MRASDLYARLMAGCGANVDPFDAHVIGCIVALGSVEAEASGSTLSLTCGLDGPTLARLIDQVFPDAEGCLSEVNAPKLCREDDEASLYDLLSACRSRSGELTAHLAAMIARRAQRPNHLWQDLGLRNRGEVSLLMQRHFAPLARRNDKDMKWKKFLYRTICRDTGHTICAAPSCSECDDFNFCFGEENGESLLARIRRDHELGTTLERV